MTAPGVATSVPRTPGPERAIGCVLVVLAACNAVLRPSVDLPVTPYYLVMPFVASWLLMASPSFSQWLGWFAGFAAYGLAVGTLYGVPITMQAAQLLKHLQLLTFLGMVAWLCSIDPAGRKKLLRIVSWLVVSVLVIAAAQATTGFEFPTVVNEESPLWLNTIFFTPNDLALFLGAALCLLLSSRVPLLLKICGTVVISALNLRNDAKAVLLATVMMIGMQALLVICAKLRVRPVVGVLVFIVSVPLLVVALSGTELEFEDTTFDFLQLFLDPFDHIRNLEPYDLGGSIFDRTDALIYSLQTLKNSHWLGLGPAGSVYTLSLPNFELLTAKSLHNALAELLVEFGPAMVLLLAWLVAPVLRSFWKKEPTVAERSRIMLLAASPMLSVSQSSGYVSNYAFWLVAFLIWSDRGRIATALRASPRRPHVPMLS